jgi:uncharacterized membrane protein HdeD (DUF308 family)
MFLLTVVFLIIFLLGGVARLVSSFRNRATWPNPERSFAKGTLLIIGIINVALATLGLYLLFARTLDPLTILIGVLLITSVPEILLTLASRSRRSDAG